MYMPPSADANDTNASPMRCLWVLMFGAFAMGNAKFSIFPLVPAIAADLNSSPSEILHAVFAYLWGGLIAAPIMAIVFRNWSKPRILTLLSVWCFLGNLLTSFATSADMLYWLRWFSGIPHAAFLAFSTLLIAEIAPPNKRGRYLGLSLVGISLSTLFVVPFNTWIGLDYGWQISFRFVALLDLLIFLLIHDLLPQNRTPAVKQTISMQLHALRNRRLWLLFAVGLCILISTSAAWTYSIAWFNLHPHPSLNLRILVLIILGIGFIVGQIAGGWAADHQIDRYIGFNTLYTMFAAVFALSFLFDYRLGLVGVFLISIAFSLVNVMMQIRLLEYPPTALYMVLCLFNACIQLGNFSGSALAKFAAQNFNTPTTTLSILLATLAATAAILWFWIIKHPTSPQKQQAS